jgi:hypothetical protein
MFPGRREWDTELLRTCFYSHDIEEIIKITLSDRMQEDVLAWQYEKSGLFSVKSAYKLAIQKEFEGKWYTGSSNNAEGMRPLYKGIWSAPVPPKVHVFAWRLYKGIWSAPVPPKVHVFAWRLSQEGLAMQYNRRDRKLTRYATCQICGAQEEDGHHAVVTCTKARAHRQELRGTWLLPDKAQFLKSGPDWLLLLLDAVDRAIGARILMLFWRAWHLRNHVVHGKGTRSVLASANFLISYVQSVQEVGSQVPLTEPNGKGKGKLGEESGVVVGSYETAPKEGQNDRGWEPPEQGWIKVNTDAGYCAQTGESSAGVVIRDDLGNVMLMAWQLLRRCASVEEAEVEACLRGLKLTTEWTVEWSGKPAIIESDCRTIVNALEATPGTRAQWDGVPNEIRAGCALLPNFKFQAVGRRANTVAHQHAQPAMRRKEFVVMRLNHPTSVTELVQKDARGLNRDRARGHTL